jgi:hypothetical protein
VIELANLVPAGHPWYENPRAIIDANTLLPVYSSFYRVDKREELLQHIIKGTGNYARALLGTLPQSGIRTENYRFCGECVKESLKGGFPVSRLEHQPSFVRVCAKHSTSLVHGCMKCYRSSRSLTRWQMAGECTCTGAFFEWEKFEGGPSDYESALWLSRQVRQLLLTPPPDDVDLASRVAEMVKANFTGRTGLDGIAIWAALEKKFGLESLRKLGINVPTSSSKAYWPQSLISQRSIAEGRGPLLKFLLLSSLVVDDVNVLYEGQNFKEPSVPNKAPIAKGYSTIRINRTHEGSEKERLLAALKSHTSIQAAASSLGMYFYTFTGGLIAAGISVPISQRILAKYGELKLQQIREDLSLGVPKRSVAKNNKVTMNVVERVELANPELAVAHRSATIDRTRDAHRKAMLNYKKLNPKAGRNEIALANGGAVDWLRIHDKNWLRDFWPAKKNGNRLGQGQARHVKRDWAALDAKLVDESLDLIAAERDSANRPRRITVTRICNELKVLHANLAKLPRLKTTLEENAETKEQALIRVIKWAIIQYAKFEIPLTAQKFIAIASLTHEVVRNNRAKIVFEAQRANIPINMRSSFALVRDDEIVNFT